MVDGYSYVKYKDLENPTRTIGNRNNLMVPHIIKTKHRIKQLFRRVDIYTYIYKHVDICV